MRKILSIVLVITFLLSFSTSALAYDANDKIDTRRNVTGIVRESGTQTPVVSKSEYNYKLSEIKLSVTDNSASIQAVLNKKQISFNPVLYRSYFTDNLGNQVFGVDTNACSGYQLTKFTIERNSTGSNLVAPNESLIGSTVATMVFHHEDTNIDYFFQFAVSNQLFPILEETNAVTNAEADMASDDLVFYELANIGAQPVDNVKASFKSIENESISGEGVFSADDVLARDLDNITVNSVVPDIPDSIFKTGPFGWTNNNNGYISTGANEMRNIVYSIHKTVDSYTGNITSFIARYEAVFNYNYSSQQFTHGFVVTHNKWFAWFPSTYVLHEYTYPAVYCMRVSADATVKVSTTSTNGHFSNYQTSGIANSSNLSSLLSVLVEVVPYLGAVTAVFQSGTTTTGTLFTCPNYTKSLQARMNNLVKPNDQVTVSGIGTNISNISCGYVYSPTLLIY